MKNRIGLLKLCVWGLSGILITVGLTVLFAQILRWIPSTFLNRSSINGDAFLLCCGLLFTGWVLVSFAHHATSAHAREAQLQSQFQVRPYITSSFDCSVKHAIKDSNSFFAQVFGSLVSAAAPPECFHIDGFVRDELEQAGKRDSYSAPEGKCLVAYRLNNICTGAAVHFSVTINNQRLFQFQSLGANAHLTLYLLFDNMLLPANECILNITLRYQDAFSQSEYTQKETAIIMQSFGQCPTVVGRMEDMLTPPISCALTSYDADLLTSSHQSKRSGKRS